jgi:hypothetical protein
MASTGFDPLDNTTGLRPPSLFGTGYAKDVIGGSLQGLRFGLLKGMFNWTPSYETTPVNDVMNYMISVLQKAGVVIVPITETLYNCTELSSSMDVQASEIRESMDAYLQMHSLNGSSPSPFRRLYSSGKFLAIPNLYSFVEKALESSTSNSSYAPPKLAIQNLTTALGSTFSAQEIRCHHLPRAEEPRCEDRFSLPNWAEWNSCSFDGIPCRHCPSGFLSSHRSCAHWSPHRDGDPGSALE